ncbi:major facilitator superfamily domain-containing protein [Hyaloraphidium curvatum]|nr:major facilitator superfamily domain-containing protein [Hyaloraphidium curvatum]
MRRHPNDPAIPGAYYSSPLASVALTSVSVLRTTTGAGAKTDLEKAATTAAAAEVASDDALVQAALELGGFGKYQWRLFWLCGLGWLNDSFWWTAVSYIQPALQSTFGVSSAETGLLLSLFTAGAIVGELFWGFFSARLGRTITFKLTLGFCGFWGICVGAMPYYWLVCVFVVFLGTGYGGNVAIDTCLFLEWVPKSHGSKLSYMNMMFSVGSVIPSVLAWVLIPLNMSWGPPPYDQAGWRLYLMILGSLNLVMLALRRIVLPLYETPYFLVSKGRYREAVENMRRVAEYNGGTVVEGDWMGLEAQVAAEAAAAAGKEVEVEAEKGEEVSFLRGFYDELATGFRLLRDMWNENIAVDPLLRRTTITVIVFWFFANFGWTSFGSFVAVLMTNLGLQEESDVYRDLIIYTVAAIPTAFFARYLLDLPALGRVGSMSLATLGTSLALVGFGVTAYFASDPAYAEANHTALVGGTLGTSVAYNMLLQICLTALWLYTPELFKSSYRTILYGCCMAFGRIGQVCAPLLAGAILSVRVPWNNALLPWVGSGLLFVAALVAFSLPLETLRTARTWRKVHVV